MQNFANLNRYLLPAVAATLIVILLPAILLWALQSSGTVRSPLVLIGLGVLLSSGLARTGSAFWMRRPGSADIVFGDLLIWGHIRRRRVEKRLARASKLLGGEGEQDSDQRAEALESLAATLEARDAYTHGHSRRITRHAFMIAQRMGLEEDEVAKIRTAATLHDVGKVRIPREILNKPGKLTDEEFAVMKRHPVDSVEMAGHVGDAEFAAIVRHHHERLDGRGYPDGLAGEKIPLGSRIIAVADTFDALTSSRPYRRARKHKEAIEILRKESGTQLDANAVDAFLEYYTARRSVAWWSVLTTAPERLVEVFAVTARSFGGASLAQAGATVAAAAVLGTSVSAYRTAEPVAHDARSVASIGALGESTPGSGPSDRAREAQDRADSERERSDRERKRTPGTRSGKGSDRVTAGPGAGGGGGHNGSGHGSNGEGPSSAPKAKPEHGSPPTRTTPSTGRDSTPSRGGSPPSQGQAPASPGGAGSAPTAGPPSDPGGGKAPAPGQAPASPGAESGRSPQ